MARLIDADALDRFLAEAQAQCKKNDGNFRFGVLSNVRANIANVPTIDAVPVEWLRKWPKSLREGAYVRDILTDWQKEQEAHGI